MGVNNLVEIFDEKYYRHLSGGILEAFGKLFFKDLESLSLSNAKMKMEQVIYNSENLKVHPRMKELYKFFKYNGKVVDITDYNPEYLDIFSRTFLLNDCRSVKKAGKKCFLKELLKLLKDKSLFGYKSRRTKANKKRPVSRFFYASSI